MPTLKGLSGPALLIAASVLWASSSAWRHWEARAQMPAWAPNISAPPPAAAPINAQALDVLFGVASAPSPVHSAAPLVLRASLVSTGGQSRALLASGTEARFYREGDRLPDGSVLRRVQSDQVLLWRNGREETLGTASAPSRHFTTTPPAGANRSVSPPLLQPLSIVEPRP